MKRSRTIPIFFMSMLILALGANLTLAQEPTRPEGWVEASHGKEADPNYAVVFPQEAVNTMTITIEPETWQAMLDDMTELYGEFGARAGMDDMGGDRPEGNFDPGQRPLDGQMPEGGQPPQGGQMPGGGQPPQDGQPPAAMGQHPPGGMGGDMLGTDTNPMWATADIEFDGQVWTNVGIRFKGNSSLMSTWGSGTYKLPFKLDFDQFEDDYPEIENQRFYGFQKLSFSSNWSDASLLREKVTADIFREAGVPAAQTAFYAVYVDYGAGPTYFGLYTAVEVIDDTVIQTQFEDDGGNLYKPEGTGATFAAGSFDEDAFEKETNADEGDYSDILALFTALHAETRTTEPATWRKNLEAVLDVDGFIHWLAVNAVVQNWDTYGSMAHNYYLYNDPTTGLLTWIPWDNNMALSAGMGGGGRPGGQDAQNRSEATTTTSSLTQENVSSDWPLIRYLLDDPVYHDLYVTYVDDTVTGAFAPAKMEATYQTLHDLIAPYVVGENGEQEGYTNLSSAAAFETALTQLMTHVNERYAAVQEYINTQTSGS